MKRQRLEVAACRSTASSARATRLRAAAAGAIGSLQLCRALLQIVRHLIEGVREGRHLVSAVFARACGGSPAPTFVQRVQGFAARTNRTENQQRGHGRADNHEHRATAASVGPSCRNAERGMAITTPPVRHRRSQFRRDQCGASSAATTSEEERPRVSLVEDRGTARPPRLRANESGSSLRRARISLTSPASGIVPSVETTRPSFMIATRGTRPSYSCRKNC